MSSGRGPPGVFGAREVRRALRWAVRVLLVVFGRRWRDRRLLGAGRGGAARRSGRRRRRGRGRRWTLEEEGP